MIRLDGDGNMELSPIFPALFELMQWIAPLSLLLMIVTSSLFKGLVGELLLHIAPRLQLDSDTYFTIGNVLLPVEESTIRIDQLIISRFGVFVVEANTMHGRIYGSNRKIWMQKEGSVVQHFENPRQQGFRHVREVASALGVKENQLFPLAVFVGNSDFRTPMPKNVIHGNDLIPYIESKTEALLSDEEVDRVFNQVESLRLRPTRRDWLAFARHLIGEVEETATDKFCPRCGGGMVLRTSRKFDEVGTQFWGCTSFPECKGVLEVTQVQLPDLKTHSRIHGSHILPFGT